MALTTITGPDGAQQQIVRDNMPFGSPGHGEFGTYFIGYAADPAVTEQMLRNMFLGHPPGRYDRILDFSTPLTGGLFFAPAAAFLDQPPGPPASALPTTRAAQPPAPASAVRGPDGSLRIGSLNRSTRR